MSTETQLNKYIAALKAHDWSYMYADDSRSYNKGREQWFEIDAMRRRLDPDHKIYNEHAPEGYKVNTGAQQ